MALIYSLWTSGSISRHLACKTNKNKSKHCTDISQINHIVEQICVEEDKLVPLAHKGSVQFIYCSISCFEIHAMT
uniref:Uncharacterized protein n=1 Tax=Arundo donax TaxID=35708 RepID=A0A0A9HBC1_ARUDO